MLVRSYNPIWSFVDLVGKQLDSTYYLFTLQPTLPYLPSPIWKDASANVVWPDPIQFLANGTLPNNMYFDNTLVYRLEIRHGATQADPLIYAVDNYIPGDGANPIPFTGANNSTNQVINPQFDTLNFNGNLIITTATSIDIAPGWTVITTGAGTLTISQAQYAGNVWSNENATNAATGLILQNNGFTTVVLRQRYNGNGALWSADPIADTTPGVAMNFTSSSTPANGSIVGSVFFNNAQSKTVLTVPNLTTANTDYSSAVNIPKSTNNTSPATAYTDLLITMTGNTTFSITSVQLVGQQNFETIPYIQTTPDSQHFNLQVAAKPIPSYLTGWDFPLNPAQFGSSGSTGALGANKSAYAWDQTILFSSVTNGLNYARGGGSNALAFQVTPANNTSWAMIQYIPQAAARTLLEGNQCVQFQAYTTSGTVNGSVSLWFTTDANLPTINDSLVASITSGFPTCGGGAPHGTWTQVTRNAGNALFTLTGTITNYSFNGWSSSTHSIDATYMAIVIAFDTTTTIQAIPINYVSLQKGNIATRPAPQAVDEVLRECQYYYEMSYDGGTASNPKGSASTAGAQIKYQSAAANLATFSTYASPFSVDYRTIKRVTAPIIHLYSTSGTADNVLMGIETLGNLVTTDIATTNWASISTFQKSALFNGANASAQVNAGAGSTDGARGWIQYQYIVDARLGVV